MKKIITLTIIVLSLLASPVQSAEVAEYIDQPTGAKVKFNDDNSIKSITAKGEAELVFGDRKDIRVATQKASMRAKAMIAKFMKERLQSEEVMDDLTKTATQTEVGGKITGTRKTLEVQREIITNSADAMLKGLVTLIQDVNRDEKYVAVTLGTNEKFMRAADSLKGKMNRNLDTQAQNSSSSNPSSQAETGRTIKTSDALKEF